MLAGTTDSGVRWDCEGKAAGSNAGTRSADGGSGGEVLLPGGSTGGLYHHDGRISELYAAKPQHRLNQYWTPRSDFVGPQAVSVPGIA
eukprot:2863608-Rhodomonas_salina.1